MSQANRQDGVLSQLGSDDYILEHAYLVERGVRPMAIVGYIEAKDPELLQAASRLEIISTQNNVIPFVVVRADGIADCGFASAKWVVDLYEWLVRSSDVPEIHGHRIRGLLLGYNVKAIRMHDGRISGRRFTSSPEQESKIPPCCTLGTEGI